ncbi:hypothetical protein D3C76_1411450 [compost metagenome]
MRRLFDLKALLGRIREHRGPDHGVGRNQCIDRYRMTAGGRSGLKGAIDTRARFRLIPVRSHQLRWIASGP